MKRRFLFAPWVLFLLMSNIFIVSSHTAQRNTDQEDIQHEVTVTLKLIQVYVTDKDGKPAMDLLKEDFEIYDKGKLIQITDFEKHTLSLPVIKEKVQPEPAEVVPPPTKMNRKFFIFFDFAYNNVTGIKNSKKAALHFIDTQLQPTDEVGVVSYSSIESLDLHSYLTTDHHKVREIVEGIEVREVLGTTENVEREYRQLQEKWAKEDELAVHGFLETKSHIKQMEEKSIIRDRWYYREQASEFSRKIKDFAKALRYIPGQKNVILFSSGIAHSVLYGQAAPPMYLPTHYREPPKPGEPIARMNYEKMIKELASANCSVFAINSEELRASVRKEDSMEGTYAFSSDDMLGGGSLKRLSDVTGGRYFDNVHNYETIMTEIQNLTGSYYVLGYYIGEAWDGKYHKIKVKVKKEGYDVHAQGGYFNPKPFTEYSKLEKQLHLVDLALSERPFFQDPVYFSVEALLYLGGEKSAVTLISKISIELLQEIIGKKVEIVSLIFDEEDRIVGYEREEKDFSKIQGEELRLTAQLEVPPGKYKCRVVIRNLKTGRGAVGSASVVIPKD